MPRLAERSVAPPTPPTPPNTASLRHRSPPLGSMPVWMSVGLALVTLGLAGVPVRAMADGPDPVRSMPDTVWRCSLTASATRLLCVVERLDASADAAVDEPAASTRSAPAMVPAPVSVRNASGVPARYPLDTSRPYTIELLGPATDMPLVAQLAQFTLCLKTPNCRAVLV